jgi:hypothetical protein
MQMDSRVGNVPHRPVSQENYDQRPVPQDSDHEDDEEYDRDDVGFRALVVRGVRSFRVDGGEVVVHGNVDRVHLCKGRKTAL